MVVTTHMLIHRVVPLVIVAALCSAVGLCAASAASDSTIDLDRAAAMSTRSSTSPSPSSQGAILLSAGGGLEVLTRAGAIKPFAPNYSAPSGLENYMTLSSGLRVGASQLQLAHRRSIHAATVARPGDHGRHTPGPRFQVRQPAPEWARERDRIRSDGTLWTPPAGHRDVHDEAGHRGNDPLRDLVQRTASRC